MELWYIERTGSTKDGGRLTRETRRDSKGTATGTPTRETFIRAKPMEKASITGLTERFTTANGAKE